MSVQGPFPAGSTLKWTGQILDELGTPIPGSSLTTGTLTLFYRAPSGEVSVVNSRNAHDILGVGKSGANNVTIDGSGNVSWLLQVADTSPQSTLPAANDQWSHTARFTFAYGSGRVLIHEFAVPLRRVVAVP